MPSFQTVEKVSFQQDIALNQLPKARVTSACAMARFDENRQTIAWASALLLFPKNQVRFLGDPIYAFQAASAMSQYLAENGVKSAKNFIAAPPWR